MHIFKFNNPQAVANEKDFLVTQRGFCLACITCGGYFEPSRIVHWAPAEAKGVWINVPSLGTLDRSILHAEEVIPPVKFADNIEGDEFDS